MNGSFYQNPTFPGNNYQTTQTPPGNISINDVSNTSIPLTMEQSYIENILRLNKGRKVKAYVSYPDSSAWQNKIYEGIIEEAGKDHLIIYDNGVGIPEKDIKRAISLGTAKINVNTENQIEFTKVVREILAKDDKVYDPRKYLGPGREMIKETVKKKIREFGSNGKA